MMPRSRSKQDIFDYLGGTDAKQSQQMDVVRGRDKSLPVWLAVGATGQPAFGANWSNFGGAETTASFWRSKSGVVYLRGAIKHTVGGIGTTIFTLPVGFRPGSKQTFVVDGGGAFARIDVLSTGVVTLSVGAANVYAYLDGIIFRAEG